MASALSAEECNRLVFEAVNEISVSKFDCVQRTYSDIEVLTSLVKCNENGETPLEIAMKGGNDSLIDELVKFLRQCREIAKCHEMSTIAIDKLFHHQIPILELIEKFFKGGFVISVEWFDFLAQVVFDSTSLSRQDKIIALELIGASHCNHLKIFEEGFPYNPFPVMFRCWRESMTLRYFPADGEPLLPKIPYVGVPSVASSVVFGSAKEVMTMEELNLLKEDFERDVVVRDVLVRKRCIDLMRRQCLLVIRRISSQANHGHPHLFYLKSLYDLGMGIIRRSDEDIVGSHCTIGVNTFLLIMEQMTGFDAKILSHELFNVFFKTVEAVFGCFLSMAEDPPGSPRRENLSYTNILAATKFISTIAKCFPNPALMSSSFPYCNCNAFAMIIFCLAFVFESISPQLNNQEKQQLEDYLSNYTRNYFLERTNTALHLAIPLVECAMPENLGFFKLFLRLGADPNAIDEKGRTPLHILAGIEKAYSGENLPVFQALVNAGTYLDMVADNGDTVLAIVKRNRNLCNGDVLADAYFGSLITTTIFPLSCYCARVIRRHGIRFDEDRLPDHLQEFVSNHSAEGAIDLHQRDN